MSVRNFVVTVALWSAVFVAESPQQQPATFALRTSGVRLDVSVFDGPSAVHGLEAKNFDVFDSRTRQQVAVVETRDAPLDLALVVQPLPSLSAERQSFVQSALQALGAALREDDRMTLVTATAGPDVLRPLAPAAQAVARKATLTGAEGVTVRDALMRAFLLFDAEDRRKAIIAITDGQHDQSWVTASALEAAALRQPAQVIVAALDSTSNASITASFIDPRNGLLQTDARSYAGQTSLAVPAYLASLTRKTGGRVIDLRTGDAAPRLTELISYLRSQYVITYTPTSAAPGWHDVDVRLKGARGVVVAREGYWNDSR